MADLRRRPRKTGLDTAIWAAKLAVLVAGVVSVVLLARIAVPYSAGLLASVLSCLRTAIRGWLVPPYLFITIHLIIITIWKLSERKQQRDHGLEEEKSPPDASFPIKPRGLFQKPSPEILHGISPFSVVLGGDPAEFNATTPVPVPKSGGSPPEPSSDASCLTVESDEMSSASSRLDIRKNVKVAMASVEQPPPEEEEDGDTMEARWKVIMKGGAAPVVSKGDDALERSSRPEPPPTAAVQGLRKPEKDGSELGHDEWNRRFDAFIKKNYEQLGLQQDQGSHLRPHMGMVNRA